MAASRVRFIDDTFPLLVTIGAARFDASELRALSTGYDRYFERGDRYAVLYVTPRHAQPVGPKERRLIVEWANDRRIRMFSERLCVGASTVITSPMMRGALTALLWLWTPPNPFRPASSLGDGVDFCLSRLAEERVPLGMPASSLRLQLLDALRDV